MNPILFPKDATVFTTEGLGRLSDCISGSVVEEKNGSFEMSFVIPVAARHFDEIEVGSIILVKPSPTRNPEPFEVYAIEKSSDDMTATVYGEHISYRLSRIPVLPFTANGANLALQGLKTNSVESNPFTFYTDIARAGTYKQLVPASLKNRLLGEEGSILQTFGGTYLWEGFTVSLLESRGIDRGVSIRYGKNLRSITQETNIQNTVTGICPYWSKTESDGNVTVVTLPEKVIYSSNADRFPVKRTMVLDLSSEWQEAPSISDMRTYTQEYITNNKIGNPHISFDVEPIALAQSAEYADIGLLERVDLCDTVEVIFPDFDVVEKAEVVRTDFDFINDRYNSYTIGDITTTLSSTIAGTEKSISESEMRQMSFYQQAIASATALLNGDVAGSRMITLTDADGTPQGLVFMDTNDPATARNCVRINTNGIGFSNNGVSGPYTSAWTIDNTFNAAVINVINLVAKVVQAYNDANTSLLEIMSAYMDLRVLLSGVWRQRVGVYYASGDSGAIRLSSGLVDASGRPTSGQSSRRTFITPNEVTVGLDEDGDGDIRPASGHVHGKVTAGEGDFVNVNLSNKITARQGDFSFVNASTIGVALATNNLTSANATWSFSITGMRAIVIQGRTGRLENQTVVIPTATILTDVDTLYGWTDSTGTTQFGIKRSGSTCTVTLKSIPSGGRLLNAYSLV